MKICSVYLLFVYLCAYVHFLVNKRIAPQFHHDQKVLLVGKKKSVFKHFIETLKHGGREKK